MPTRINLATGRNLLVETNQKLSESKPRGAGGNTKQGKDKSEAKPKL